MHSPKVERQNATTSVIEIEVRREEIVTAIACHRCGRKGEARRVTVTPPSSIGNSVTWSRVPDGWWVQGSSIYNVTAECAGCFETAPKGTVQLKGDEE